MKNKRFRRVKEETGLYFDSLKHFKNNVTNLVTIELLMLTRSKNLHEYLSLKSVNAKSKLPDMKKIGLLDYEKQRDNVYLLSSEGRRIVDILTPYADKFIHNYTKERNPTIRVSDYKNILNEEEYLEIQSILQGLLLSYYSENDFMRPYLILIKLINKYKLERLDDEFLRLLLSQTKIDVLNGNINPKSFEELPKKEQDKIKRPVSYIKNFLMASGVIDEENNVIMDVNEISKYMLYMNEININELLVEEDVFKNDSDTKGRSINSQKDFRRKVLENYKYRCIISGKPIIIEGNKLYGDRILLDAAHIIPYSEGGSFDTSNGIAMSPEYHRLFDMNLFAFEVVSEKQLKIITSNNPRVKDNGVLEEIDNKIINLNVKTLPNQIAIQYRSKNLF